jgi:Lipocalin-like domain
MRHSIAVLILSLLLFGSSAPAQSSPVSHPNREALLGAWRLVSIAYSGPHGTLVDPVFGANSQGLIIYDSSGWMSVQIFSADRPAMPSPARRTTDPTAAEANAIKTAAFDSYYAYFGTWEYDAGTTTITHHLKSSLLPYETGVDYRRSVSLSGGRLELTVNNQVNGESRKRVLVWERVPS